MSETGGRAEEPVASCAAAMNQLARHGLGLESNSGAHGIVLPVGALQCDDLLIVLSVRHAHASCDFSSRGSPTDTVIDVRQGECGDGYITVAR